VGAEVVQPFINGGDGCAKRSADLRSSARRANHLADF
jgi:hypothetical protein